MRKILSLSIVLSLACSPLVFAAPSDATPPIPTGTQIDGGNVQTNVNGGQISVNGGSASATLNAAPNPSTTLAQTNRSLGSALGEFKSVSCSTNPAFATNSCDQCFEGNSVKVGENISGLFDNWLNNTSNILVAYKEEQKLPNMVRFGNTTWTSNPADESKFWKYSSDVVWVQAGSGGKNQYILPAGQSVKFYEAELGAGYKLEKTDKKNGEVVGMLRIPVVSHVIDSSANESAASTAYECATFSVASTTIATPVVTPATQVVTPKPTAKEITSTKTGPETLVLIIAAFFIAFGLMFSLRRRV